jgi:hypothetical protein
VKGVVDGVEAAAPVAVGQEVHWFAVFAGVVFNGAGGSFCIGQELIQGGGYRLLAGGVGDRGHWKWCGVDWNVLSR